MNAHTSSDDPTITFPVPLYVWTEGADGEVLTEIEQPFNIALPMSEVQTIDRLLKVLGRELRPCPVCGSPPGHECIGTDEGEPHGTRPRASLLSSATPDGSKASRRTWFRECGLGVANAKTEEGAADGEVAVWIVKRAAASGLQVRDVVAHALAEWARRDMAQEPIRRQYDALVAAANAE